MKVYHVNRAFNSVGKDGKEQKYFTEGNAHEVEDFLSEDELNYRLEKDYLSVEEVPDEVQPLTFQRPVEQAPAARTPARRRSDVSQVPRATE